jgi:hypothetical protein
MMFSLPQTCSSFRTNAFFAQLMIDLWLSSRMIEAWKDDSIGTSRLIKMSPTRYCLRPTASVGGW